MKYKAGIFDHYQYLYDDMEYSDHQVRCTIDFEGKLDAKLLERAAEMLIRVIPILSRKYIADGNNSYWEDADPDSMTGLFTLTESKEEYDAFTASRTDALKGPQIKFCLLRADRDSLSAVINHMVSDAAGFKQCMYLLAEIYSRLVQNPDYIPDYKIDGDRGFKHILSKVSFPERAAMLLFDRKDSNQESRFEFPLGKGGKPVPFIESCEIPADIYRDIREICKKRGVTVNDVVLTAFFRSLSEKFDLWGTMLEIPIMIDMRKYLDDKSFSALANLSSTTIVRLSVEPNESFGDTLEKISAVMRVKKAGKLGMTSLVKMDGGAKIPFIDFFEAMKRRLKNPKICMTNIGIIDAGKLHFENSPVNNAVFYASLKYRPYFQISVTSFNERLTIGAALRGTEQDRANIRKFLELMDAELKKV